MLRKTLLLFISLISVACAHAQKPGLYGARIHQLTDPVDTLMVLRNSAYYSGKNYNVNNVNVDPVYFKWDENPEYYYPMIYEAWNLCLNKCPEQINLYTDGINIHRYMISKSVTEEKKREYFNKMEEIYNKQILNVDLTNSNVRKKKLTKSKGSLELSKIEDWIKYSPDCPPEDSLKQKTLLLYRKYASAIESIKNDIEEHRPSGDMGFPNHLQNLMATATNYYYFCRQGATIDAETQLLLDEADSICDRIKKEKEAEIKHYIDSLAIPTRYSASDPIIQKKKMLRDAALDSLKAFRIAENLKRDQKKERIKAESDGAKMVERAKQALIDNYNLINDVVIYQKKTLGEDFVVTDSTWTIEQLTVYLDSAVQEIALPYDNLLAKCNEYLESQGIYLAVSITELAETYQDSIESHKTDTRWLERIRSKCEEAFDFQFNNKFYMDICAAYVLAINIDTGGGGGTSPAKKNNINKYFQTALQYAKYAANPSDAETRAIIILYAIWNCDQAKRTDPANANTYNKYITSLMNWVKNNTSNVIGSMGMIPPGTPKTLRINGKSISFTVSSNPAYRKR